MAKGKFSIFWMVEGRNSAGDGGQKRVFPLQGLLWRDDADKSEHRQEPSHSPHCDWWGPKVTCKWVYHFLIANRFEAETANRFEAETANIFEVEFCSAKLSVAVRPRSHSLSLFALMRERSAKIWCFVVFPSSSPSKRLWTARWPRTWHFLYQKWVDNLTRTRKHNKTQANQLCQLVGWMFGCKSGNEP